MDDFRRELIDYRIERSKEECLQSQLMLNNGFFRKSVNCSYYAVFHAIRALAARDGFDAKKHSSVLAFFNKDFATVDSVEAEELLLSTKKFVAMISELL